MHLLRTLLRLDPWIPYKKTWLAPALPPGFGDLRIERFTLAGARVSLHVSVGRVRVGSWPEDIELIEEPRSPLTDVTPPA